MCGASALALVMTNKDTNSHLTSGRLLARNTAWNLAGQILPMLVGILTIPVIIRAMGVDRFGVLSLAWVVVGYFSLFDLGIGRALTKMVADKLGANEELYIAPLAWTSLLLMFVLGICGAAVTLAVSPLLVHRVLKIPEALQNETLHGFYLLAVSIPIVTLTAGLRGVLEALQRFRLVNLIRIPMSVLSVAAPLLVFPFSRGLVPVIAVLAFGRLIGCLAHVWACFAALPVLRSQSFFDRSFISPLVGFGSWMTVNNLLGPLLSYIDRFLVGALLSVTAVAYYTTPIDLVLRLIVIPLSIVGVLFPAFAMTLNHDPARSGMLLTRGLQYVFLILFPVVLVILTFAPEGLRLWLGPTFSVQSSEVLRWAAAGVFINSLSVLPFGIIHSAGRPDITAWLLLGELPAYGIGVWLLTRWLGIEGTAIAWTGRYLVELVLVFFFFRRLLPEVSKFVPRQGMRVTASLAVLYLATLPRGYGAKIAFLCIGLTALAAMSWRWITPDERRLLRFIQIQFDNKSSAKRQTEIAN